MNTIVILDQAVALSRFVVEVDNLHDALLHEAVLRHPGYVDQDRNMWGDAELPEARLIFQSQSPDFCAVQVNLSGVTCFRLDPQLELRLETEFGQGELIFYLCGRAYADRAQIRAAYGEYMLIGKEFLGCEYKLAL